jgi:hypothetical protein
MFQLSNRARNMAAGALALTLLAPQAANAAPLLTASPTSVHGNAVTPVGYYRHHHRHGGPAGAILGAALGLFALGAAAAASNGYEDYYDYPYYPYGPVAVYPGYGYYGYPYGGGFGGWHGGGWRGHGGYFRGPMGHFHR